jgi:hypothetical protein
MLERKLISFFCLSVFVFNTIVKEAVELNSLLISYISFSA